MSLSTSSAIEELTSGSIPSHSATKCISGVIWCVPTLDDHDFGPVGGECPRRFPLVVRGADRGAEQRPGLGQVRRDDPGEGKEALEVEVLGVAVEQAGAAGRHEHGIDDEVREPAGVGEVGEVGDGAGAEDPQGGEGLEASVTCMAGTSLGRRRRPRAGQTRSSPPTRSRRP